MSEETKERSGGRYLGPSASEGAATGTPRAGAASGAATHRGEGEQPGGCGGRLLAALRAGATARTDPIAAGRDRVSSRPVICAEDLCAQERPEGATRRAAGSCPRVGGAHAGRLTADRPVSYPEAGPLLDNRHRISSLFKPLSFLDVYKDGRILINPRTGEIVEAVVASRPIFKANRSAEERRERKNIEENLVDCVEITQESKPTSTDGRAAARARRQVFELAAANEFDLFFTLTLNAERIDRYDYKAAVKKLGIWLSNRVQRHGMKYVAVPELHKDKALHFHGLCNAEGVGLIDSGRKWKGKIVYNLDWGWGFSTAVKLDENYEAAARYIAKYVTKSTEGGTICGRYYFHGGALDHFLVQHFCAAGAALTGTPYRLDDAGLALTYVDLKDPVNLAKLSELTKSGKESGGENAG